LASWQIRNLVQVRIDLSLISGHRTDVRKATAASDLRLIINEISFADSLQANTLIPKLTWIGTNPFGRGRGVSVPEISTLIPANKRFFVVHTLCNTEVR
jgi:hypothetical protein